MSLGYLALHAKAHFNEPLQWHAGRAINGLFAVLAWCAQIKAMDIQSVNTGSCRGADKPSILIVKSPKYGACKRILSCREHGRFA